MCSARTIRVTGKGQIRIRPDMTRITVTLEGVRPEYEEALRSSSEGTEQLKTLLAGFGFERTDLKTLAFSVDTEYEDHREKGVYRQRLVGYRYRHTMKVEFDSDNDRLGKVLYALAHCALKPELSLSYTVKDPEAAKNELLGKAVSDAMEKAAILARAAGVARKDILQIDHSWGRLDFEFRPADRLLQADAVCSLIPDSAGSYDMDIEPDDIEASDTVTVVWEIG